MIATSLIILTGGALLIIWFRHFKQLRIKLEKEREADRLIQSENKWLENTTQTITAEFKNLMDPEKIAEVVVDSLGRTLSADVIGYSFVSGTLPKMFKQYRNNHGMLPDETLFDKYAVQLTALATTLWEQDGVLISDKTLFTCPGVERVGGFEKVIDDHANSWLLVPVGDGSQILGLLLIMARDIRTWNMVEVSLVRKLASESASVCIHASLLKQSLLATENDAQIGHLEDINRSKNDFIESMNHELRSPLSSIIAYMEMILEEIDPELNTKLVSSLTVVQRNALRLQGLIENMMQLSKTDAGAGLVDVKPVDINKLLGNIVKSIELDATKNDIDIMLLLPVTGGELFVDGDGSQIERLFVNLISNAVKFTPKDGKVTITAHRDRGSGNFVEIKVADTGIGIAESEFPNMFKRFFRASSATKASIPGFGIGLSLVHAIVEEHGGTITFSSKIGVGSEFVVRLPVHHTKINNVDEPVISA